MLGGDRLNTKLIYTDDIIAMKFDHVSCVAKLAKHFVNPWQNGEAESFENKVSRMSLPDCTMLNWPQTLSRNSE